MERVPVRPGGSLFGCYFRLLIAQIDNKIPIVDSYKATLVGLGRRARALRILRDMKQGVLAGRAGLAPGTVVRFERTGRASMENVLRIATVLGAEQAFDQLFELPKYSTLDDALARPALSERKRVRTRSRR